MRVRRDRDPPRVHRAVATIGVFDGVHRAHHALLRATVRLARRLGGTSVVVTFDPDPQHVLAPRTAAPTLMPLEARLAAFAALGIEWTWVIPFTRRFARTPASVFVRRLLIEGLRVRALLVGAEFAFGRGRRGTMTLLRTVGPRYGVSVYALAPVRRDGGVISSSRIRRLIAAGHLHRAARLLGHPPTLHGRVVPGAGRGRRLGFPTANLALSSEVLPPQGVYAAWVQVGARRYPAALNLGVRPTFGTGPLVCEAHVLRFSGTLRGRRITVSLVRRLRGERCFPSPRALQAQLTRDIDRARRLLRGPSTRPA